MAYIKWFLACIYRSTSWHLHTYEWVMAHTWVRRDTSKMEMPWQIYINWVMAYIQLILGTHIYEYVMAPDISQKIQLQKNICCMKKYMRWHTYKWFLARIYTSTSWHLENGDAHEPRHGTYNCRVCDVVGVVEVGSSWYTIWVRGVPDDESCHIYEWVMAHMCDVLGLVYTWCRRCSRSWELSVHNLGLQCTWWWDVSHIWMSHGTHIWCIGSSVYMM